MRNSNSHACTRNMSSKWSKTILRPLLYKSLSLDLPFAFINLSQVADLENLHAGIEYYYKGGNDGCYRPRPGDNYFLHFI
jgi:hypothetical protein